MLVRRQHDCLFADFDVVCGSEIYGGEDSDGERQVDVDVDPALLADATSVTSLILNNLPLGDDRASAIIASAPPTLKTLQLTYSSLESVSWEMFASVPELEVLNLRLNKISLIRESDFTMAALTQLYVSWLIQSIVVASDVGHCDFVLLCCYRDLSANRLSRFNLQAPMLTKLCVDTVPCTAATLALRILTRSFLCFLV